MIQHPYFGHPVPNGRINELMKVIAEKHKLILSSFVIEELIGVVGKEICRQKRGRRSFLKQVSLRNGLYPEEMKQGLFHIRDEKDYSVLYTAIMEDVDILITGDKDFFDIEIEKPEILTLAQFLEKYY